MIKLAWRNVWRNRRRSLITIASMGSGLAAIMFGQSLIKSLQYQLVEKSTGAITGHVQVQHREIEEYKFPDKYIDDPAPVAAALAADPRVKVFAPRINLTGLASSPAGSVGVLVSAIDPEREARITTMTQYLVSGEFLGRHPRGAVLGQKLAERLDLRLGEKLVLMAQAADGSMGAEAFRLVGIFRSGSTTFDGQIVYVPLPAFQELLAVGGKVNHFVARLHDIGDADAVRASLSERLAGRPVRALNWKDVDYELLGVQRFQNAILDVVLTVVFAIVALGVLNTLLMSLFERVREFGVLMAIGARPRWVMRLVVVESILLGIVGTLAGFAGGCAMIAWFGRQGLNLPLGEALSYFIPFPSVIYLRYVWASHLFAAGAVLLVSVVAAAGPALRAARMRPAEALRHV